MISSRKEENVIKSVQKLTNEGLSVSGQVCDVTNAEHRQSLFKNTKEKFGGIDILVSNAGINPKLGYVLESDESSWDEMFHVNVKCSFLLAKEALPYLRERKGSNIVFVSSIAGLHPYPYIGAYSVSKTALIGLTKAAAKSLVTENIRVNCLAPGIVKTKFSTDVSSNLNQRNSKLNMTSSVGRIPMQRSGTIEEMGAVVAFLVSDDASYITGETIAAGGGIDCRL
ncbi:dehydrogenase/reductase SDR family member 4-like isoform X2 [Chrysoperla carnea]|nr:dehydrogenase/reductase SDR family member 4-like isoform X2 [Chrysoperla carnea]